MPKNIVLVIAAIAIIAGGIIVYRLNVTEPIENEIPGKKIELQSGNVLIKEDSGGVVVSTDGSGDPEKIISSFVKFRSEEEFKDYVAIQGAGYFGLGGVRTLGAAVPEMADTGDMMMKADDVGGGGGGVPERFSDTNVQVAGIDEPDIVKTNGKEIYFSPQMRYYIRPMIMEEPVMGMGEKIMPPNYQQPGTHVISAFPPENLNESGTIDAAGNLLLKNNILVVLENTAIYGYDVSDPSKPKEKWNVQLDSRNSVAQARLYGENVYLITRTAASRRGPCPIPLFTAGENSIIVPCTDVYHPKAQVSTNVTYHVSTINVASGEVQNRVSFVGSYDSLLYMSANALYVAYSYSGDYVELMYNFFTENSGFVPQDVLTRINKLRGYDISDASKMNELYQIISDYTLSLSEDDELKFQNELANKMESYVKRHKRELEKTDIVKIKADNFLVDAISTIPGRLLNQFSMDEYKGHLRVAVTVGGGGMFGFGGSRESENDVYVLDNNLDVAGSIKGLGIDERIYSARFIQDKGYVVTFRQVDPFFVLDLSDPKNPQVKGKLKIPGYSSYLHPITKNKILGVGKEDAKVKVSLFDVSSPSNPKEISKYTLDEYWSDILNTHHAFLMDDKFKVFFMPGGRGGYVFSYAGDDLSLKKAVSGIQARRALFIDDYLYIIGENKIVVLDENSWEKVNSLELK